MGHLTDPPVLLAIFGIVITVILYAIKLPGSIFIGMIITAIVGMFTGLIQMPSGIVGKIQVLNQRSVLHLKRLKTQVNY